MAVTEDSLTGTIEGLTARGEVFQLRVRLDNHADRSLHFIARVRALDFDSDTRQLTVRLHDQGRRVIPGAANVAPQTQFIDPGASTEINVELPNEITKLIASPDGDLAKVAFIKHRIVDAATVAVTVGWADVPYYEDPRPSDETVLPSVLWQQHRLTTRLER